ncbi:MAG: type II toxin-antitoxin system RelE/ParE family toxin [Pseudomonadales bacterium]|nr:type II toxin-antitoxin system RelE/ParE family toxin [Pseudomonadales bacterium]
MVKIRQRSLRVFYETGNPRGLPQELVPRIRRILAVLDVANHPAAMNVPGFRLHPLSGDRADYWSVRVSGNRRIVFRFENSEAVDVELIDYH